MKTEELVDRMRAHLTTAQEEMDLGHLYQAKLPLNSMISLYTIFERRLQENAEGYDLYRRCLELLMEINGRLGNQRGALICERLLQEY